MLCPTHKNPDRLRARFQAGNVSDYPYICGSLPGEFAQFLRYALASLDESELRLQDGVDRGYLLMDAIVPACQLAKRCRIATLRLQKTQVSFSRRQKERGHEAWSLRLLAEISASADPPVVEQAEGYYRAALALADELGMRPLAAHCHLGLGTLYQKIGHNEQAKAELATAVELYRAMAMTFWLEKVDAALAQGAR